jgi:hypothetical protein
MGSPAMVETGHVLFSELAEDRRGHAAGLRARRVLLTGFAILSALALWGLFGQRASETTASAPAASLTLSAPHTVRGGLFFQSRLEIRTATAIGHPRVVLDKGWVEGMQVNSIEPAAQSESSRHGRIVLSYDPLKGGDVFDIWLQFEVDPTNVGHRSYGIELDDAEHRVVRIDRSITILP